MEPLSSEDREILSLIPSSTIKACDVYEPIRRDINKMDHIVISHVKWYNQLNDTVDNEVKFDMNTILSDRPVKDPKQILNVRLIRGKILEKPFFWSNITV